jgi:hypothetical protein
MHSARVFIVHVWIDDGSAAPFRAAVQCADTDESGWFTEAAALVRWFEARAAADAGATTDAGMQKQSRTTT